jgi:hypothetical protein
MAENQSEIVLRNLQIKSLEKAQRVAKALNILEEECGIKETMITFENVFWCPWIDKSKLNQTEMQKLLVEIQTSIEGAD